jgi:hypothetical protein
MTEVVSYRINEKNSMILDKEAKKRGMPIATLTSKIMADYLNNTMPLEDSGYLYLPKAPLKIMLKLLDESMFYPIIEAAVAQFRSFLSIQYGTITDEVVLDALKWWCDTNRVYFEIFKENALIKIVCSHSLGINWSKIVMEISSQLFVSKLIDPFYDEDRLSFNLKNEIITKEINNLDWLVT